MNDTFLKPHEFNIICCLSRPSEMSSTCLIGRGLYGQPIKQKTFKSLQYMQRIFVKSKSLQERISNPIKNHYCRKENWSARQLGVKKPTARKIAKILPTWYIMTSSPLSRPCKSTSMEDCILLHGWGSTLASNFRSATGRETDSSSTDLRFRCANVCDSTPSSSCWIIFLSHMG